MRQILFHLPHARLSQGRAMSREKASQSGVCEMPRLAVHDLDERAKPGVNIVAEGFRRMLDFKDDHHR